MQIHLIEIIKNCFFEDNNKHYKLSYNRNQITKMTDFDLFENLGDDNYKELGSISLRDPEVMANQDNIEEYVYNMLTKKDK